jgi:hypothetical protein
MEEMERIGERERRGKNCKMLENKNQKPNQQNKP